MYAMLCWALKHYDYVLEILFNLSFRLKMYKIDTRDTLHWKKKRKKQKKQTIKRKKRKNIQKKRQKKNEKNEKT